MRPAFPLRLLLLTTLPLALACGGTVTDTDVEDAALSGTVNLFGRTRPAQPADADSSAVELGVRFRASVAGKASGVRFYKGRGNGGTHTGHLWSSSGQLLASTTFKSESASGWQSAVFAQPVSLTAGQLYVVSYYAPTGHYAGDNGFFAQAFTHGVLSAPKSGDGGGNGVYHYGATAFPTDSWEASNYYVDVAFLPGSTPPPPPVPDAGTPPPPVPDAGTPPPPVTDAGTPPVPDAGTPPPPSQTKNCAPNPHLCGYPDATNTGVPAGTTLRRVPEDVSSGTGWTSSGGSITVTGDGAVLDALSISGNIEIYASNVTVKRCRIVATGETWAVGLRHANNTTVEDSEMYSPTENGPARLSVAIKDIYGDMKGGTFQRNNIYHASTAIQVANGTVRDNFIHDYGFNTGDHLNGVSVGGGDVTAMLIEHNTILNQVGQTDAIALFQDFGNEANKTINDNLVGGGGYCIYAGAGSKGTTSNIRVTNNRIAVTLFPAGGSYGWLAAWDEGASTDVHSGNVWDDDSVSADGDFTGHH